MTGAIGTGNNFRRGYTCAICFEPAKLKDANTPLYIRVPKYLEETGMREEIERAGGIMTFMSMDFTNAPQMKKKVKYTFKFSGYVYCETHGAQKGIPRTQKTKEPLSVDVPHDSI
jgi:hypothetical protein